MRKTMRRISGLQTHPDLDHEQREALKQFAKRHGRLWKAKLAEMWVKAEAPALLHRLRNTHGPDWLRGLSMADIETNVTDQDPLSGDHVMARLEHGQ